MLYKKFRDFDEAMNLIHKVNKFNNQLNKLIGMPLYFTKINLLDKSVESSFIYNYGFNDDFLSNCKNIRNLFDS